jgi:hypothetical protein
MTPPVPPDAEPPPVPPLPPVVCPPVPPVDCPPLPPVDCPPVPAFGVPPVPAATPPPPAVPPAFSSGSRVEAPLHWVVPAKNKAPRARVCAVSRPSPARLEPIMLAIPANAVPPGGSSVRIDPHRVAGARPRRRSANLRFYDRLTVFHDDLEVDLSILVLRSELVLGVAQRLRQVLE